MRRMILIGIAVLLAALVAVFAVAQTRANRRAAGLVDEAIANAVSLAEIQYEKASANLFTGDLSVKGIEAFLGGSRDRLTADALVLHKYLKNSRDPGLSLDLKGLSADAGASFFGGAGAALKKMGYARMSADARCLFRYNAAFSTLEVEDLAINIEDLGKAEAGFSISNLRFGKDNEPSLTDLAHLGDVLADAAIGSSRFVYEDISFFNRLLALRAHEENKTESAVKEEEMNDIRRRILNERDPEAQARLMALKRFVDDPRRISVILDPEKPVPIQKLKATSDPGQWPDFFRMKVSAS